jgi:hypothetical protein
MSKSLLFTHNLVCDHFETFPHSHRLWKLTELLRDYFVPEHFVYELTGAGNPCKLEVKPDIFFNDYRRESV